MTKLSIVGSAFSLTAIALIIGLVAGQAAAQDVDAKGDKELTQLTQKIDKSGKMDKPDKPEKPERLEKPEKPEKPEKAEKPGR